MLIDSFPYAGEIEILKIRLAELFNIVDVFLIVESNKTQTGLDKPYFLESQYQELLQFKSKIFYLKIDDSKINKVSEADWSLEMNIRQSITVGLEELNKIYNLSNLDYLMISDCDEIPKASVILDLIKKNIDIVSINHYFGSYYLNIYSRFREPWGWYGTILTKLETLHKITIQELRNIKDKLYHTGNIGEGWHFSNLLVNGFESLYAKWIRNIEPHDKKCLSDKELLKSQFNECFYNDKNLFFCDNPSKRDIPLIQLDNNELPEIVKNNLSEYKSLIYG